MDSGDLLKSLIPLILIIVFSWLFSALGSRMKKRAEQEQADTETDIGEEIFNLFSAGSEEEPHDSPDYMHSVEQEAIGPEAGTDWDSVDRYGSPVVTPDPIKPRWWGA
jgi:hypothetical protein